MSELSSLHGLENSVVDVDGDVLLTLFTAIGVLAEAEAAILAVLLVTDDTALPPINEFCSISRGGVNAVTVVLREAISMVCAPSKNPTCGNW